MTIKERARGSMLGMAAGDALGTTIEFAQPGKFELLTDIVGGGPFFLEPGEWTDDTSMALCLADSLIVKNGFDPVDQMERYVRWWQEGYLSSNGECFDMGNATRKALQKFMETWEPYCGSKDPKMAGNGSIMRLAPIPIFYRNASLNELMNYAAKSSQTTHGSATCIDACEYMSRLIVGALQGLQKSELLSEKFHLPATEEIAKLTEGSYRREPPEINGAGYVVTTLEAALWAFNKTDNFKDGCLRVVNLGLDSDTTGAVYGQIAGAYYGESAIPAEWREKLAHRKMIEDFADKLVSHE